MIDSANKINSAESKNTIRISCRRHSNDNDSNPIQLENPESFCPILPIGFDVRMAVNGVLFGKYCVDMTVVSGLSTRSIFTSKSFLEDNIS